MAVIPEIPEITEEQDNAIEGGLADEEDLDYEEWCEKHHINPKTGKKVYQGNSKSAKAAQAQATQEQPKAATAPKTETVSEQPKTVAQKPKTAKKSTKSGATTDYSYGHTTEFETTIPTIDTIDTPTVKTTEKIYTDEVAKKVDISGESGIIKTGAYSGAKKTTGWQERHADRMYEEIRHRSTDVKKIAQNTPFKESAVEEIKQHMFFTTHKFSDGSTRRFDSDFEQAQAWDRLTKGEGTATDIELLKHEYVELTQMRIHGYDYETAHNIANAKHNWWAMVEKEE